MLSLVLNAVGIDQLGNVLEHVTLHNFLEDEVLIYTKARVNGCPQSVDNNLFN